MNKSRPKRSKLRPSKLSNRQTSFTKHILNMVESFLSIYISSHLRKLLIIDFDAKSKREH